MLFISWMHIVPSYVRTELKKKTGIVIDEFGKKIDENMEEGENKIISDIPSNPHEYLVNVKKQEGQDKGKPKKEYTPITTYKPSGNLLYDDDILNKIENKFFK